MPQLVERPRRRCKPRNRTPPPTGRTSTSRPRSTPTEFRWRSPIRCPTSWSGPGSSALPRSRCRWWTTSGRMGRRPTDRRSDDGGGPRARGLPRGCKEELAPAKGSSESTPALHLRMVVSNNGTEPWTVDTREQKLDIEGSGPTAPAFSTTSEGKRWAATGDGRPWIEARHVAVTVMAIAFGGSESLPDGEGAARVELAARSPSHPVARVELELVDDQEMHAQTHRVRRRQLVGAGGAIEPGIRDCIVEQTHLEHVSQERQAILEVHCHEPPGIFGAERPAQEVAAADRLLLRKHDEPGARHPPRLEPELVPSQGPHLLVARGQVQRRVVTRVRRSVDARAEGELVVAVAPDRLRIEGQRKRRVRVGPRVREGVLRPRHGRHSALRFHRVEQPPLHAYSQRCAHLRNRQGQELHLGLQCRKSKGLEAQVDPLPVAQVRAGADRWPQHLGDGGGVVLCLAQQAREGEVRPASVEPPPQRACQASADLVTILLVQQPSRLV